MRNRFVKVRGWAWRAAIPAVALAAAGALALPGAASASHAASVAVRASATSGLGTVHNLLDCNRTALKGLCTDPHGFYDGKPTRFLDPATGLYVGHDEPSVKFISSLAGSGNTMTYGMRLSTDPAMAPTASTSVSKYGELSVAPWFGLPMCDPQSYPQNPCTPLSDTNSGSISNPAAAGSAFMELQFYPPGFTPFIDSTSCSNSRWCAAVTIDSLACSFNFATCNNQCIEPVNFAFLQTNGVPAGPPAPQDTTTATLLGNAQTLKMNPGDVLKVSISDVPDSGVPDVGGFKATVQDLTSGQTGTMTASAANGFKNTSMADCSGTPFSFHAEYSTARKANQVPWAALEGGVLMEQEIGHGEACTSVSHKMGFSANLNGTTYADPNVFQTCNGGSEGTTSTGAPKPGEGPCNSTFTICQHPTTQGKLGQVACSTTNATTGKLCEFSDGFCFPKGSRSVLINGTPATENWPLAGCTQTLAQNGDLDFDGTSYVRDWPNGGSTHPSTFRYVGPFTNGHAYSSIQFETDVGGSERLCNVLTGSNCTAPPLDAKFYPFWTMNNVQALRGLSTSGVCVWNFGNVIANVTSRAFGGDKQYGTSDLTRYGGTLASRVLPNPELGTGCKSISF